MITIRSEQPGDESRISQLLRACFPTPLESILVERLRVACRLSISIVAEAEDQMIGMIAFSPVITVTGQIGLGLAPVAVQGSHRRQGIAKNLIEAGIANSREMNCGWIVVLGEPAYYSRFGFQPASSYGLQDEYGGGDAFQILELLPNAIPRNAGLVRYAPEFDLFQESS